MAEEKEGKSNVVIRIILAAGIAILAIAIIFALIFIIPRVISGIASIGQTVAGTNKIELYFDKSSAEPNKTFSSLWKYKTSKDGFYSLSYSCENGVEISFAGDNSKMECGKDYEVDGNKIDLISNLTGDATEKEVGFHITYKDSNTAKVLAEGKSTILIARDLNSGTNGNLSAAASSITTQPATQSATVQPTVTPNVGANTYTPTRTTYYNSYATGLPADLAITDVSMVQSRTLEFTATNIGGVSTGSWRFSYQTPGDNTEYSPYQMSLNPGDSLRFTVRFDTSLRSGYINVKLDSNNNVRESNESNNSASVRTSGSSNNNNDNDNNDDDVDLYLYDLEAGYVTSGNNFHRADSVNENDDPAIRFKVKNKGDDDSEDFDIEISVEGDVVKTKSADGLDNGDSEEYIIKLDESDFRNNRTDTISVEVDPDDDINETNESNNDDDVDLEITS